MNFTSLACSICRTETGTETAGTGKLGKAATSKQVENDADSFGYGYLFWGGRENTFRADGKYCQWSIISREKNAVITVIAECRRDQELMDAVFTEVFPQV